jgi:hypothetical protein
MSVWFLIFRGRPFSLFLGPFLDAKSAKPTWEDYHGFPPCPLEPPPSLGWPIQIEADAGAPEPTQLDQDPESSYA